MKGAWIEIKRNSSGEVRRHRDEYFDTENIYGSTYIWTDGNYSCDCNRSIFFFEAGDEDDPTAECGETQYTAIRAICDDGEIVSLDEEE